MFNRKLKGGALYIALIICIVIGIVLSTFILIAYHNQREVILRLSSTQLRLHLVSGKSIAQSRGFNTSLNNKWQQLASSEDSIRIKKLQWGAYEMISVEAKNRHQYVRQAGLYGSPLSKDTGIVTRDNSRPVGLAGKIKLTANCYFPKGGYKPAFIEGQSFNADGPLQSYIKEAPAEIPAVGATLVSGLKEISSGLLPSTDSLCTALSNTFTNSFSARTVVWETGKADLNNYHLSGNIKITGTQLTLENTCLTNNILLVADKVTIKKGFKGSLHIIARDSIVVENDCVLEYPSSLTVFSRTNETNLKGIFLGENCEVNGALLAITESAGSQSKVFIKLNKDCKIYGLAYSEGYCHIEGSIYGNIYCAALLLKTPSAVYENHILSAEVNPQKYSGSLVVPSLFNSKNSRCAKWL